MIFLTAIAVISIYALVARKLLMSGGLRRLWLGFAIGLFAFLSLALWIVSVFVIPKPLWFFLFICARRFDSDVNDSILASKPPT